MCHSFHCIYTVMSLTTSQSGVTLSLRKQCERVNVVANFELDAATNATTQTSGNFYAKAIAMCLREIAVANQMKLRQLQRALRIATAYRIRSSHVPLSYVRGLAMYICT